MAVHNKEWINFPNTVPSLIQSHMHLALSSSFAFHVTTERFWRLPSNSLSHDESIETRPVGKKEGNFGKE
jgi:hypothetical protein